MTMIVIIDSGGDGDGDSDSDGVFLIFILSIICCCSILFLAHYFGLLAYIYISSIFLLSSQPSPSFPREEQEKKTLGVNDRCQSQF